MRMLQLAERPLSLDHVPDATVELLWVPEGIASQLWLKISSPDWPTATMFPVPEDQGLPAFHHPFAYA